jgi:hypothetical protein
LPGAKDSDSRKEFHVVEDSRGKGTLNIAMHILNIVLDLHGCKAGMQEYSRIRGIFYKGTSAPRVPLLS